MMSYDESNLTIQKDYKIPFHRPDHNTYILTICMSANQKLACISYTSILYLFQVFEHVDVTIYQT